MKRRRDGPWRNGNQVQLLENGEAYYPAVFAAIAAARQEVLIETFILFEDTVGAQLEAAIDSACRHGARVFLTVDGYGSADLSAAFVERMRQRGATLRMFDPPRRLFGNRINLFRRLHRKIVVVDGCVAFVGGINFSADHLRSYGPEGKQDYAIALRGPVVQDIRALALSMLGPAGSPAPALPAVPSAPPVPERSGLRALFVSRDNHRHPTAIERLYLLAIRKAQRRIVIANAYFFPGYRILRALRQAARRGVQVQLILQGNPDLPAMQFITRTLYAQLAKAGIEIHEYQERPLHAKVAVVDDWATVGSSNLDPLSLSLNLEANVFFADAGFAATLQQHLDGLLAHGCQRVDPLLLQQPSVVGTLLGFVAYHFSRHFPRLAKALPRAHLTRSLPLPAPKRAAQTGLKPPGSA